MKTNEAAGFLLAFKNEKARDYVKRLMLYNYSDAILKHHPAGVTREQIYGECQSLLDEAFAQIDGIRDNPKKADALFKRLSRLNPNPSEIWFEEFDSAYENYKHNRKLFLKMNLLKPFLSGNSFCDIGCGGGDLVYFLKNNYPQFQEYAGIDVIDWRTEIIKDAINFQMLDFSIPGTRSSKRYDTLTCIAVLHHVGNTRESINVFLQNIRSAISERGKLIIEEDVMLPLSEIQANKYYYSQVEKNMQEQPLFSEFIQFNKSGQKDIFILIDLFANSFTGGVVDMAYPYGFRSIKEWTDLFTENGFKIEDVQIKGFQKDLFNRSSHVYFILRSS